MFNFFTAGKGNEEEVEELKEELEFEKERNEELSNINKELIAKLHKYKSELTKEEDNAKLLNKQIEEDKKNIDHLSNKVKELVNIKNAYYNTELQLDKVATKLLNYLEEKKKQWKDIQIKLESYPTIQQENNNTLENLQKNIIDACQEIQNILQQNHHENEISFNNLHSYIEAYHQNIQEFRNTQISIVEQGNEKIKEDLRLLSEDINKEELNIIQNVYEKIDASQKESLRFIDDKIQELVSLKYQNALERSDAKAQIFRQKEEFETYIQSSELEASELIKKHQEELKNSKEAIRKEYQIEIDQLKSQIEKLQGVIQEYKEKEPNLIENIKKSLESNLKEYSEEGLKLQKAGQETHKFMLEWIKKKELDSQELDEEFMQLKQSMLNINEYKNKMFQQISNNNNETMNKAIEIKSLDDTTLDNQINNEKINLELIQVNLQSCISRQLDLIKEYKESDPNNNLQLEKAFEIINNNLNNIYQVFNDKLNQQFNTSIKFKDHLNEHINKLNQSNNQCFQNYDDIKSHLKSTLGLLDNLNLNLNLPTQQLNLNEFNLSDNEDYPTTWPRTNESIINDSNVNKRNSNNSEVEDNGDSINEINDSTQILSGTKKAKIDDNQSDDE